MTLLAFTPNQRVTVTKSNNQFAEGEQYRVVTTNKINGMYSCVLKDEQGNIKGALPQDYLKER